MNLNHKKVTTTISTVLFLLISLTCQSQFINGVLGSARDHQGGDVKTYTSIPTAPTFTDSHTVIQSSTGVAIQSGDTGGKTQLIVGSNYTQFQLNGLTGSYYIKSDGDENDPSTWRTIGGSTNDYSLTSAGSTPNVFYYNLNLTLSDNVVKNPVNSTSDLKTMTYQNLNITDAAFAAIIPNETVSGQGYGNLKINHCTNHRSGGEFIYSGHTGTSLSDYLGVDSIFNCYSDSAGREGIQMNNHASVVVFNNTCRRGGQDIANSGIGQSLGFQFQGIGTGEVFNNIFDAKGPGMIASCGLHFYNNYVHWTTTNREIYLQDITANGYHFEIVGDTVIIEDNIFHCPGYTLAWMFRIQEENCYYIIRNNIFPASATDIIKDERSSTPYTITMSGNTFTDSPPTPSFGPPPEAAWFGIEEVVTDDYFYNRHIGARTP